MPLAAARPVASIGTVLSPVPWMTSVGTRNAGRSGRKSVWPNASAQASVGFRPACIASGHAQSSTLVADRCETQPTP